MDVNNLSDEDIRSLIASDLSQEDVKTLEEESLKCSSYEQAIKLIPDDLKVSQLIPNEYTKKYEKQTFDAKKYLMESEFMSIDYTPTISFMQPKIFIKQQT